MDKKYLIIAVAVLALGCIGTLQAFTHLETQEPQEIRGIVVDEHDAAWYEQQQTLWLKKAQANPTDEHAWEQCFSAARYADMLNEQYGMTDRKKAVLDEMAMHIPNSFTFNLAMYQTKRDMYGEDASPWAEKALQQIPKNIGRQDASMLIAYLEMSGKCFSDKKTQETSHELEGNALYFINGDVPWYGSRILQEALDLHKDKKVIPISFLAIPVYRDALCQSLGIKPFEAKENYDSIDNLYHEVLEYIINKSKRPAYFSPHFNSSQADDFPLKLYNEGLVFRYSAKRYDNMAVAQRNVEEKYHLEYLLEPQYVNEEQWQGSERIQLNYMVMLAPVVKNYKQAGDTLHANRLARYLSAAVTRTSLPQEEKQKYFNLLSDKK